MYFYLWNQWQILPEKSLIRKYRLSFAFFTIQHLWLFIKSILGDYFSLLPYPLLFIHHYPETYKPKFHCRRQSGMNFGYVHPSTITILQKRQISLFLKICLFCKYFYIIHFFHALPELTIYKNILSIIYLRSV